VDSERKTEVCRFLIEGIEDEYLFSYREGSTKFNGELRIVDNASAVSNLENGCIIYSIDTLDFVMVGEYEGFGSEETGKALDIDACGKFEVPIMKLAEHLKLDVKRITNAEE
jgi:hypothetical protein